MKPFGPNQGRKGGVIRTLIVDDSEAVRTSLVAYMAWVPKIEVIGTAGDGAHALTLVTERHPDLVLMDLDMPVMDGLQTTRLIRRRHPATRVVLMTVHEEAELEARGREAGAAAFLSKAHLCERLEAVLERLFPTEE
jgi:DNA-binding NarL/FixJ family response regulator